MTVTDDFLVTTSVISGLRNRITDLGGIVSRQEEDLYQAEVEIATLRAALLGNLRYESAVLVDLMGSVERATKYVTTQAEHWKVGHE